MLRNLILILGLVATVSLNPQNASADIEIFYSELGLAIPMSDHCIEEEYLRTLDTHPVDCFAEDLTSTDGVTGCYGQSAELYIYTPLEPVSNYFSLEEIRNCPKDTLDPPNKFFTKGEGSGGI